MQIKFIKKIAILIGSAMLVSIMYVGPIRADENTNYLKIIAQNTTNILIKVNDFPSYIAKMLEYALNMQKSDDSQATKDMQGNFATTGNLIVQDANLQLAAQPTFNTDLLGPEANKQTLPNANDLVYSTLLGQPIYNPDPRNKPGEPPAVNPPYNYIKNAAGINIPHVLPRFNWRGLPSDLNDYISYYNTVTATASYNGYVLSNQLAELQNNNGLSNAQLTLVTQASNSDWIAQIASEEIGKVLRQILLFESQTYVLMTQLLHTQKQLLAAQAMTNGLLIAANKGNERLMLARAQGIRPT